METRRRQLTRQSDDVAVFVGQSRSPVTISIIIIAFAAARETTAVVVADASRVVLTRGVGPRSRLAVLEIRSRERSHQERNIWIGLIIRAVFRAQFANTIKSGGAAPFGNAHRES